MMLHINHFYASCPYGNVYSGNLDGNAFTIALRYAVLHKFRRARGVPGAFLALRYDPAKIKESSV